MTIESKVVYIAAISGDCGLLIKAVKAGYVQDRKDDGTLSQIVMAFAGNGNTEALGILFDAGVDVNIASSFGESALYSAVKRKSMDSIKFLIERGVGVNAGSHDGTTPLHLAAELGYVEVLPLLINAGADIEARDMQDYTPLMRAAASAAKQSGDAARILLDAGADKDKQCAGRFPVLGLAVINDNSQVANMLLDAGVVFKDNHYVADNILHHAVHRSSTNVISMLLQRGEDVNARDEYGDTALHLVCNKAYDKQFPVLLEMMIMAGADVDAVNNSGKTPMQNIDTAKRGDKLIDTFYDLVRKRAATAPADNFKDSGARRHARRL